MRHLCRTALLATSMFSLITGCQQANAPTDPALAGHPASLAATALSDPATVGLAAGVLTIDREAGTAEFLPVRGTSAIGDTFSELGLAPAFTEMFGTNFRVTGLRRTGATTVEVDFEITHPFPAATRPDLAVFNLKAWIVSDDPATPLGGVTAVTGLVTNADGYGQMWSTTANTLPAFATADLQPYVILNEDPSSNPFDWQSPAGFNVFFPGQSSIDTVGLDLGPATQTSVRLFITGDYGQSAVRATRQTPAYELPKFAGEAAWKIAVTEISNNLEGGQTGSTASYQVNIWDWKHGQSLGSDVASATLSVPGITTSPLTIGLSGTGQDPTPLTGTVLVTNAAGASDGDYWGLVTVADAATNGIGLKEDLTTPITVTSYVTYQVFPVSVETSSLPPTALITRCFGGDLNQNIGDRFDGLGSTDGTNPITTWEWDWDYDGMTFDVESTGAEAIHAWDATGIYTVALRVSDGGSGTDIDTTVVNVTGAASWSAVQRVTTNSVPETFMGSSRFATPAMATGPDGTIHFFYLEAVGTGVGSQQDHKIWHVTYGGCPTPTFSAPEQAAQQFTSTNWNWNVSTVVTPDNVAHVSFTSTGSIAQFRYVNNEGGTWSAPVEITTFGTTQAGSWQMGNLAATPAGAVGFLARDARNYDVCPGVPGPPAGLWFTQRTGTSWSAQQRIGNSNHVLSVGGVCGSFSPYHGGATLAATADGEWVAVWASLQTQYDGFTSLSSSTTPMVLNWNQTTSGTWGTETLLYAPANDQYRSPMLKRSPDGTLWLMSDRKAPLPTSNVQIVLDRMTAGAWSVNPTTLATITGASNGMLGFNFGPDGTGILGYTGDLPRPMDVRVFHESDALSTIASMASTTLQGGTTIRRRWPQLGVTPTGRGLAVWQTDEYGTGAAQELNAATYQ